MKTDKIIIRGEKQESTDSTPSSDLLRLDASYQVRSSTRGASERHEVKLNDDSVVEFVFEDGTTWLCSPNTIDEVFPEITVTDRAASGMLEIPLALNITDGERGPIGNVLLKLVNVFTKKKLTKKVKEFAMELEMKQLENQVGLFRVDRSFQLQKFSRETSALPYLLFLHGTATSTKGSFGGLEGTETWNFIHDNYEGRVIAFQHESLTKGPLQNVLDLIISLPKNCSLHIVSQSHGGLVGELLSRFCNSDEDNLGFSEDEINFLKKSKRDEDVKNIGLVREAVAGKNIRIEKFIRVACPAGGSTLASKRLDHFLNVLFNLISLGTGTVGGLVLGAFKNLIAAVIDSKNDVDTLPGLEALNPKSPFIAALTFPGSPVEIDNPLIIISGNCKMKVNLKGLLVIVTKLFFGHKNDLVVDTDSMYSGTRRKGMVQFFLDEGSEVDHFHYYRNKRTNDALLNALKAAAGELAKDFKLREVGVADAERGVFGLEIGQLRPKAISGSKPILVLLPGIMGSNLTQNKRLVWIDYLKFLAGDLARLNIKSKNIEAPSIIRTSYSKIEKHLSATYDVVVFPFDWRLQLAECAQEFNKKIKELMKFNQPIKIIAHSMGGVLVRDFMVYHTDTWEDLNRSTAFKLIFLGAPLGGSYRIPAVLFGEDSIISTLGKVDIIHSKKELLEIFSKLPGILSLLPHSKEHDFSDPAMWQTMRGAFGIDNWPLPSDVDLKEFGKYRDKIQDALESIDYTNVSYIAGRDKRTRCGFRIDETKSGKELVFLNTGEGDQSVTWESGIPAKMVKNDAVYYVDVTHGALANEPDIFDGITDILASGSTNLLSRVRPAVPPDQKLFRGPEVVDFDLSPEGVDNSILGLEPMEKVRVSRHLLKLSVSNGDLKYSNYPVLAGHFNEDGILYAEKVIDRYLDGALSEMQFLGLYPGPIGSNEVLLSSSQDEFKGAVIIGLGDFGALTGFQLAKSVEQGTCNYLVQMNKKQASAAYQNGISSLIIGCGYAGLTIEGSVTAIIDGVSRANDKIKKLYGDTARLIDYLEFVEQDKNKALNCFYALNRIKKNDDQYFSAVLEKKVIIEKPGLVESHVIDGGFGWWTRMTVQKLERDGRILVPKLEKGESARKLEYLLFNISTGGAREEQRILQTSREIIDQFVKEISVDRMWSSTKAKTIFELLIPNDFKERVKKQNNIIWVLDIDTAAFPWELLKDTSANSEKPLAVNAGMVRQLATKDYRIKINAVTNMNALVVGDPELNGMTNQLPGAFKEAQVISSLLTSEGFDTVPLLKSSPGKIIESLFSEDYKIIHLAGHGVYNPDTPEKSGMVIGNNVFLTTGEISQMSSVPELVFVNCCYLAKVDGGDERYYQDRNKLAANIGVQLIQNGVKAVIAAGWAVNDDAALEFAEVFYKNMFAGDTFGDAVRKARATIFKNHDRTNTWGAYQCYGDPYYKLRESEATSKRRQYDFVTPGEVLLALANLHSEIETNNGTKDEYLDRIEAISNAVDQYSLRDFYITEKEAMIYSELYEYDLALLKFDSLRAENISLSFPAMERYCSIRVKKCVLDFIATPKNARAYIKRVDDVVKDFNSLLRLGITPVRYAGLGATFKRKSLLISGKAQKIKAYEQTALYYQQSYASTNNPYSANSLANWLEAEHILVLLGKRKWGMKVKVSGRKSYLLPASINAAQAELSKLKGALSTAPPDKMDYRDLVGFASVELCQHLLKPTTNSANELLKIYRNVWKKAGSLGKRLSEIEHFDFLIDAYGQLPKAKSKAAVSMLEYLKGELMKVA